MAIFTRTTKTFGYFVAGTSALLLSGCGGGVAQDIGNAIGCALSNCTESPMLTVGEISTHYTITQIGNAVEFRVGLGKSANVFTIVKPSGADRLSASYGNQSVYLTDLYGDRSIYTANLVDDSAKPLPGTNAVTPLVTVNFHRGADTYASTVYMPPPFEILSPSGPTNLGRSTGKIQVRLGIHDPNSVGFTMAGNCQRTDGSNFDLATSTSTAIFKESATQEGMTYRINTLDLDLTLNQVSKGINTATPNQALVKECGLDFTWTENISGQTPSAMSKYGYIIGQKRASHKVYYFAQQ